MMDNDDPKVTANPSDSIHENFAALLLIISDLRTLGGVTVGQRP